MTPAKSRELEERLRFIRRLFAKVQRAIDRAYRREFDRLARQGAAR